MRYGVLIILGLLFVALFISGCAQKSETTDDTSSTTEESADADENEVLKELDSSIMEESDDVELGDII